LCHRNGGAQTSAYVDGTAKKICIHVKALFDEVDLITTDEQHSFYIKWLINFKVKKNTLQAYANRIQKIQGKR
jgi:Mor family transcriptional regulator